MFDSLKRKLGATFAAGALVVGTAGAATWDVQVSARDTDPSKDTATFFETRHAVHIDQMEREGMAFIGLATKDASSVLEHPFQLAVAAVGGMLDLDQMAVAEGEPGYDGPVALIPWNPISLSLTSGCVVSICLGSGCIISSVCAGSLCGASRCGGSVCGATLCGGSVCGGSICGGSVCGGSACGGSSCGGSSCGGSGCSCPVTPAPAPTPGLPAQPDDGGDLASLTSADALPSYF